MSMCTSTNVQWLPVNCGACSQRLIKRQHCAINAKKNIKTSGNTSNLKAHIEIHLKKKYSDVENRQSKRLRGLRKYFYYY